MNNFLPAKKPAPSFLANSPRKNKDARPDKRPAQGASRTPPTRVGARRTLRDVRQRMWLPHAYKWCAGCAREIAYVGRWMLPRAPYQTPELLVTQDGCG